MYTDKTAGWELKVHYCETILRLSLLFHLGGDKRELVLDYIIERKRMDDLSSSIIDGRYSEQKVA